MIAMVNRLKHARNIARRRWSLDENEIQFIEAATPLFAPKPSAEGTKAKTILVQMPVDYFFMSLFAIATQFIGGGHAKLVGLWPYSVLSAPRHSRIDMRLRKVRRFFNTLERRKWQKLYAAIGVSRFLDLHVDSASEGLHEVEADRIWRGFKSKQDVLDLKLNGTEVGDLVYDTYLRYRVQATMDITDPFLKTLLVQALDAQAAIRRHIAEDKFDVMLTSYSSYIQHGIPAREAVAAGLPVYTAGNLTQYFKKLGPGDTLHTESYWKYPEQLKSVPDRAAARNEARIELEKRFSGAIDKATAYMKTSAYSATGGSVPPGVEAVVFLHDFFDSPHSYRHMIFPDIYEWTKFTIETIVKENLPIAIKPHPNQLPESALIVAGFKAQYPSVQWLDPKLSNMIIFKSGIKCGISIYGTVLNELAYHGIPALAAGDHPHVAFDIATTAVSVDDYRQKLIGFLSLRVAPDAQDQVLDFYYMHQMFRKEDLEFGQGQMSLRDIDQNQTEGLKKFMKMHSLFHTKKVLA